MGAGAGRISLGGLLVFLTYLAQLFRPVRDLSHLATTVYSASAGAERIIEFLDAEPPVRDRAGALELDRVRGEVEFEGVTFRYPGTASPSLRDASITLQPGETVALVGAGGAGKSTLAKLLLRLLDPDAGTVRIDGHDLRAVTLASLREQVGILLQEPAVLDASVRDSIAYGRPDATEEEVVAAARAADANEFVCALPDGYDTRVGQRGRLLSGGQRQRLAIARAHLRDTPVLVLDEPSTALDADAVERILRPLGRLMQGRTTLVISHDLLLAGRADRIVVLEDGVIVEQGSHAALLAAGGRYARRYARHVEAPPEAVA